MVLDIRFGGALRQLQSHLFLPSVVERKYRKLKNITFSLNRQNYYYVMCKKGKI